MVNKAATLGEYLNAIRTRHGYSLHHVADLSGLAASSIKRIEDGTHATPSPEVLFALADAFNIPVGVFAGFIDSYRQLIDASLPTMTRYLRTKYKMTTSDITELKHHAQQLGYPIQ